MSSARSSRIIVLGAASAMAEETCRLLAAEGAHLCLLARDDRRLSAIAADLRHRGANQVQTMTRDLSDMIGIEKALALASDSIDGADTVLIFYGALGEQAVSETDLVAARRVIDVNFTSAALWALASASLLERAGEGALLVVSSVAGDRGRRSNYVYGSAKAGLSVLIQGIAHRFAANHALRAIVVKAGFVDTPMTAGMPKGGPLWATPKQIASTIVRAVNRRQTVVYAPWFWRWIMLIIRYMPEPLFKRLNI